MSSLPIHEYVLSLSGFFLMYVSNVGEYHQLNGHEFEQAPGDGKGQGSLVCCSPRGHKESDTTE